MPAAESPRFSRLGPDERRAQLLAAAREAFATQGLAGASTPDIAKAAGVTRGLLYHYFGTKRELYLAVVEDIASAMPDLVTPADPGQPLEAVVAANVDAYLDAVERDAALWMALMGVEAVGSDPEVEAIMDRARDEAVERMAANHTGGHPVPDELRLVLRVFLGALEAGAREFLLRKRASRAQVKALLVGTLLAMVREVAPTLPPR